MKAIRLEWFKLRRKRVLLTVLLILTAEMAWAFMAAGTSFSRNPGLAGWEPLIATVSSMNGLFWPILAAICVSRICDMEHKGNTWKLLAALSVKRGALYAAKFAAASAILLGVCLLQALAVAAFGLIQPIGEPVPLLLLVRLVAGTAIATLAVIALQQWLSLAVKNQAFALTVGLVGGFIGLTADLFPQCVSRLFVWAYYTGLSPVSQLYADDTLRFAVRDAGTSWPAMAALLAAGIGIYAVGSFHVSRQER